jgi:hypothetical protein
MMPLAIESHLQFVVYVSIEFCQNLFDLVASLNGVLLHCLEIYAVFSVVDDIVPEHSSTLGYM